MPIIKTKGAASSQGFGEFTVTTPPVVNYIEDVFSTYLYKGNGSTQTVTNGIDLAGNGGLVWIKNRTAAFGNRIYSNGLTASGYFLYTNSTNAQANSGNALTYASNGWSIVSGNNDSNDSIYNYASWTFREQPKFFDIVTYTGDGTSSRSIPHNLSSTPGCMIVRDYINPGNWWLYHRSLNGGVNPELWYLILNTTNEAVSPFNVWGGTAPTSTNFSVGSVGTNDSGGTYVAYLFAHDAGGFGLTGTDNVITCGSYSGSASNVDINLGYEAQWVLVKNITTAGTNWQMLDIMRGMPLLGSALTLAPNLADAESSNTAPVIIPTATGMTITGGIGGSINSAGSTYIYIAIRRGPMKVPTLGTTVFAPALGSGTAPGYVSGFPVDLGIERNKGSAANTEAGSRLTGATVLQTNSTAAEANSTNTKFDYMNGFFAGTKGTSEIAWMFRRAPGFFDEVCYTGNGVSGRTLNHNLGVSPTMMIVKIRNGTNDWYVYHSAAPGEWFYLDSSFEGGGSGAWTTSATTFGFGTLNSSLNATNDTYVAYLFATCTGVSKVGSYTGTGALQTINCGFTSGVRFVLIKRIIVAGDWYVYDSARGITSGNDPYLLINSTAAEVTGTNYVDTDTTGFKVTAAAPADLNANGGTFIFFAVA